MKALHLVVVLSLAALVAVVLQLMPEPDSLRAPPTATVTEPAPASTPTRFVIDGARVFDGEKLWPQASVQVRDGRIEAIAVTLDPPADYARIDARGQSLLPGLIDAHVHTWGNARRDALRFGVTTILDMFSDHRQLADARRARESFDAADQADLWSAGTLATAPGGHGTQFGMDIPTLSTPDEAATWVSARKAEGSDWIKLVREDLHTFTGNASLPTLDDATAAAVISSAHTQGLRAVVHASGQEHARASLRDGADGLVHGFEDALADEAFLTLAQERKAFVVATLTVVAGMAGEAAAVHEDPRIAPWLTAEQHQTLAARFGFGKPNPHLIATARENLRRLHASGVTILAGSDAPNPGTAHGAALHEELAQLVRAGLTPAEALVAATSAPARAFGLADRGRIAAGMRADLILVDGDPTKDITATRAITTIWKNGRAVARDRAASPRSADQVWRAGRLGDFDAGQLEGRGGAGWSPTTDKIASGQSEVRLDVSGKGANGSAGALRISGEVRPGATWPWAGALYSPGSAPMQAVDASALRELVFQARGDGREYRVLVFSGPMGGVPAMQAFVATPEWREVRMPFADFPGLDATNLRGFALSAGLPQGAFALEIDAVEVR